MTLKQKSLLAIAVSSLLGSGVAVAADIATESLDITYSNEFLLATGDSTVTADALVVVLGAEYTVDDTITLSFSGAALDPSSLPTSINVAPVPAENLKGLTLGLLSADENQALYRVTAIDGPANDSTVGVEIPIGAAGTLEFDTDAVQAAGGVTVSFAAATNTGLPLDTSGGPLRSFDLIDVVGQFEGEVTASFNGIVDVEEDRLQFVFRAGRGTNLDILDVTTAETSFDVGADVDEVTYTMAGDFSWVVDTDTDADGIQPAAGVIVIGGVGCSAPAVTASEVQWTCPDVGATTLQINLVPNTAAAGAAGAPVLDPGLYFLTADVDYSVVGGTSGVTTVLDAADAGRWRLNGAQVVLPYMPFGTGISQVVYVANNGAQTGEISADVIDENTGEITRLGVIGTVPARSTLSIGPAIRGALPANLRSFSRTSITITVNAPSDDIEVYGMYRIGDDRTTVPAIKISD